MKQHDFLATLVKNPDLTIDDLRENDITPDNSSFLSKDEYKNNPNVIEAFKDESGKFDEKKFNTYYDNARVLYANYASDELVNNINTNFTYGPDAWFAPEDAVYRNDNPIIYLNKLPSSTSQGISYITEELNDTKDLSIRELAQKEKVYNYETGKWLDWTPNDKAGLFKPIGLPTLVLAQWDENGTHLENGIQVEHRAGDIKLNANGRPYYETLGGREIYNKDVLRNSDILTVDGSKWNRFDFLDSDDVKKSIPKTLVNVIAKVAPMFIPGVGEIYGYFGAADGLVRVAPVLLKSINGIIAGSNDNPQGRMLSKWEAYVSRYDQTASDWGREHMASIEGVGNLITDISRQLFEQKAVSTIPVLFKKLRGAKSVEVALDNSKNLAENSKRLALAYMATTSAQDVYSNFKQAGANDVTAGLGMLASTLALYRLMNIDYFRDNILKDTFMDESEVRRALRGTIKDVADRMVPTAETVTKKQAATFVKKVSDYYHDTLLAGLQKSGISGLTARGLSEGTEEVMEEVTTDLVKGITEGLNALGIPVTRQNQDLDFGWSLQDFATRYGTAFAGGFVGGMIFAGQSRYEQWLNRKRYNLDKIETTDLKRLTYYIANGKRKEIDAYLDRWYNKGTLGSKNLSIDGETMFTLDGKSEFVPSTEGITQNEAVYRTVKYTLDVLQDAIESEVPDMRYLTKEGLDELRKLGYNDREVLNNPRLLTASAIAALGDYSSFQSDVYDVITKIAQKKSEISNEVEKLSKSTPGTEEERKAQADNIKNNERVKELQEELKDLREKKDALLTGAKNKYYAGQALFAANQRLQQYFVDLSKENFTKIKYGLSYDSFSEEERQKIDKDYNEYINKDGRNNVYRAFDLYLSISSKIAPILQKHSEDLEKAFDAKGEPLKIMGLEKYFGAKQEYDNLNKEFTELQQINPDELTEDQKTRMIELQTNMEARKEEMLDMEKNPTLAMITADPVISEFFAATDMYGKMHLYNDYVSSENNNGIAANILNILRQLYQHAVTSGEYRFDDAELQALLQGVATSYKVDGGASTRWNDYEISKLDTEYETDPSIFGFNDDVKQDIFRVVDNIVNNLGVNNAAAMRGYNELLELLKTKTTLLEPGNEQYLNDFLSYMLPTIDGNNVIDIIKEFDGYREKIKYSAFLEIASLLGTDVKDIDLLSLVQQESLNLSTQLSLTDYIIKNKSIKDSLKGDSINALLAMTSAVIRGAHDGTNDVMNNFKDKSLKGDDESIPELATISDKAGKELEKQGNELISRINFLTALSDVNSSRSLLKHKNTAINMRPKWIKALLTLKDSIEKEFGFDIEELWKDSSNDLSLNNVNSTNYTEFEKAAIKFEDSLYDEFEISATDDAKLDEITEKLLSLVNSKNLYKTPKTKLSDSPDEVISDLDLVYYFIDNISVKSSDFYKALLSISDPEIAPVYGQVYAVRHLISQISNTELYNKVLDKIKENADYSEFSVEQKAYYENKTILKNLGVVLGGAGSGKTVAVVKKILNILNNNSDSVELKFIAKHQSQANKVAESGGSNENNALTVDSYLRSIGIVIDTYTWNEKTHHFVTTTKSIDDPSVWDDNSKLKIAVIDEIETLSEAELKDITTNARLENIFVLGLGDLKQPGVDIKISEKKSLSSSIEDCLFVSTPVLTTSMRAQSIAQFENADKLGKILENALAEDDIADRTKIVNEIDGSLYYYDDPETGVMVGAMSVDTQEQIDSKIKTLTEIVNNTDKEDLIIITEDNETGKYDKYKSNKVKIVPYKERAGVEATYVIVDVDFTKHDSRDGQINNFLLARDLYTLTQRATKGTVIKVNDNVGPFTFVSDKNKASIITLDKASVEDFTRWWNQALEGITPQKNALKETIEKSPLVTKGMDASTKPTKKLNDNGNVGGNPASSTTVSPESVQSETSSEKAETSNPTEIQNEEPSVPGGINPTETKPATTDPGQSVPEAPIKSVEEKSIPTTDLKNKIIGLSEEKVETGKELITGLSEIFSASKSDILATLPIAKGDLSSIIHNEAVVRNLQKAVKDKYGNPGVALLGNILHNLNNRPISDAMRISDIISRLIPDGNIATGSVIENTDVPTTYLRSDLQTINTLINTDGFNNWALETREGSLAYRDIRSTFGKDAKEYTQFAKEAITRVGSYVRTGNFGTGEHQRGIKELVATELFSRHFRKFVGGNTEKWIVPYNKPGVGLLVTRHYSTTDEEYFDIPILVVNTDKYGKYNGNILTTKRCQLKRTADRITLSELSENNIYFSKIAGVVYNEASDANDVDSETRDYLVRNDGKPMIAYTDELAIKEILLDYGPNSVFVTSDGKSITGYDLIRIMGIQCRCSLTQLLDLINQYKQHENINTTEGFTVTSTPRVYKNSSDPSGEVIDDVESRVLNNGSLIFNERGEIKQILPRERAGQLLTFAFLNSKEASGRLAAVLNMQGDRPTYKTTYVLEVNINKLNDYNENEVIAKYSIGFVDGKYVVGAYNDRTGKFEPNEKLNIGESAGLDFEFFQKIITKLQALHNTNVVPSVNLRYNSFGKGKNYTKLVTTNWELSEFISTIPEIELIKLSEALSKNSQFKYGVYLNDNTIREENAIPNSYYLKLDMSGRIYDTDLTVISHTEYAIDPDGVTTVEDNTPVVVKQSLSDFMEQSHLGIKANTVEEANESLLQKTSNGVFDRIVETDAGYEIQHINATTDPKLFAEWLANRYNITLDADETNNVLDLLNQFNLDIGYNYVVCKDDNGNYLAINANEWSSELMDMVREIFNQNWSAEGYLRNKFFKLPYDEVAFSIEMINNPNLMEAIDKLEEIWPC